MTTTTSRKLSRRALFKLGAAVADLARVGRPGAPLALTAFTPAGFMGRLLDLALRPRAGAPRPARWGRYESAFLWLDGAVEGFEMTDGAVELRFDDAGAARRLLRAA